MNLSKARKISIVALIAALLFPATRAAHAQYVQTGTTAGGGVVLIGSGSLPQLGPGSPLSAGGFDQVTISSSGSTGPASTIIFSTPGDTLTNAGSLVISSGIDAVFYGGANGSFFNSGSFNYSGSSTSGVHFSGGMGAFDNSNIWLVSGSPTYGVFFESGTNSFTNSGMWSYAGNGLGGVFFSGENGTFVNSGIWSAPGTGLTFGVYYGGGSNSFTNSGVWSYGGNGAGAVYFSDGNDTFVNSGTWSAPGTGLTFGVYFGSGNNSFTNSGMWSYGGNGSGGVYFSGGNDTFVNSGTWSAPGTNLTFGVEYAGGSSNFTNSGVWSYGGNGVGAVYFSGGNDTFVNSGTWSAPGTGLSYGVYFGGGSNSFTNTGVWSYGGNGAAGVYFSGGNDTFSNSGTWSAPGTGLSYGVYYGGGTNSFTNSGIWSYGGNGAAGVYFSGGNDAFVNSGNWSAPGTGLSYGVYYGGGTNSFTNSGIWSYGGNGAAGVYFSGGNGAFVNSGNWSTSGTSLSYGVYFGGSGASFTNSGNWSYAGKTSAGNRFSGGANTFFNSGNWSAPGGANYGAYFGGGGNSVTNTGVWSYTGNGSSNTGFYLSGDGSTLTNKGSISVGGSNPVAMDFEGSNNVVNLDGHSSVTGLIKANGNPNSNILNLNFTGLSPAEIASLKSELAADGALSGKDSSGSFTVRGVTYHYDPLVVHLNVSSYQLQAATPNQAAIGASLDSTPVNPPVGSPLFNLYTAIDASGNVPGALEALSPQKYQAYRDLAIQNTTAIVLNLDARLNNIRDGSENIDTSGLGGPGGAPSARAAAESGREVVVAGLTKDDGKGSKEIVQPAVPEQRWGMFATGYGLFFRGNRHDVDVRSVKSNDAGTLAGIDAKIGDHAVGGAFFAYNNSDAQLGNDGSHATVESYSGGLYGSYHQDGFYLNGIGAYTRNHYSSDRSIVFPGFNSTATASTKGNQFSANLDGGYDWHVTDRLTLGPIAGIQYVRLDVDGFNETGGGIANLAVGSQGMNSLQSRVGGRADYHLLTSRTSSFAAEVHAAWQHEYLDDSRGLNAAFTAASLTPFTVRTSSPLRDAAVVGVGLNVTVHDRLTLFAGYELLFWRASYFEQTVNGGGRISF